MWNKLFFTLLGLCVSLVLPSKGSHILAHTGHQQQWCHKTAQFTAGCLYCRQMAHTHRVQLGKSSAETAPCVLYKLLFKLKFLQHPVQFQPPTEIQGSKGLRHGLKRDCLFITCFHDWCKMTDNVWFVTYYRIYCNWQLAWRKACLIDQSC